jgi:hypothetical protein
LCSGTHEAGKGTFFDMRGPRGFGPSVDVTDARNRRRRRNTYTLLPVSR